MHIYVFPHKCFGQPSSLPRGRGSILGSLGGLAVLGVQLLELIRAVVGVVVDAGGEALLVVKGALGEAGGAARLRDPDGGQVAEAGARAYES